MTYPITGEYLENLPEPLQAIFRELEDSIFEYICSQFAHAGDANEKSVELIRQLQRGGLSMAEIEKRIKKTLGLTQAELDRIFDGVIGRNQAFYTDTLDKMGLVYSPVRKAALAAEEAAIYAQTMGELRNITQSLGFAVQGMNGKIVVGSIQDTYIRVLDVAAVKVQSGAADYNSAIRGAVDQLADSGLQWVDYASGWHNRVEVAVRRAVMTGVGQLSGQYSEALKEDIGTDYVEVSAHRGARDKGVGAMNHASWQGRVFRWNK